jgi:hypothetical protein
MKANELRIGNIIEYIGRLLPVTSEIIREVELNNATGQPIPLTEEWLIKFGFKKSDMGVYDEWFVFVGENGVFTIYQDTAGFNAFHGAAYNCTITIKFIHQLQNVYFSLTGNELELKP